eukprot:339270-Hanusia_phi.AAC.4
MSGIASGSYFETGQEKSSSVEEDKMDLGSLMQTQTQLKMENAKVQPNEVPNMNDLSSDDDEMQKSRKPLAGISEENDDEDDQEEVIDYFVTEDFVSGGISGLPWHTCREVGRSAQDQQQGRVFLQWGVGSGQVGGHWKDSGTYDGMWRGARLQPASSGGGKRTGHVTKENGRVRLIAGFDTPLMLSAVQMDNITDKAFGIHQNSENIRGSITYLPEWQNGLIFGRGNFKFPNGKEIMADFEDSCPVAGTIRLSRALGQPGDL